MAVDYCADGTVTTTTADDDGRVLAVAFEMGSLYVCDTTLEHTADNDAAFHQDDTPADFHGEFVSFVARAAEVTAAASACPTEELDRFRSDEYRDFVVAQLAERHGLAADDVDGHVGRVGASDDETRRALDSRARPGHRATRSRRPRRAATRRCRSSTWPATARRSPTRATSTPAVATSTSLDAPAGAGVTAATWTRRGA